MILTAQEIYNHITSPINISDCNANELTSLISRSSGDYDEDIHIHISTPISIQDIINAPTSGFAQHLANILGKYSYHQSVIFSLYISNYKDESGDQGEYGPFSILPIPLITDLSRDSNGMASISFSDHDGHKVVDGYLSGDIYLHKVHEPLPA